MELIDFSEPVKISYTTVTIFGTILHLNDTQTQRALDLSECNYFQVIKSRLYFQIDGKDHYWTFGHTLNSKESISILHAIHIARNPKSSHKPLTGAH